MWQHLLRIFLLIGLIIYIFENSIANDFAFDDHLAIVNNADTDPNQPFIKLWGNDIWGKGLRELDSHRSYRPLLIITFKILRSYFGLNAGIIRIASIVSHTVNTIIIYLLGLKIIGNVHISFLSSLLFATHPVHVESVTAVVNIAEPLSSIFLCLAYLCYLYSISSTTSLLSLPSSELSSTSTTHPPPPPSLLQQTLLSLGFIICLIISILYKETAITLIAIVIGTSLLITTSHYLTKSPSHSFSLLIHLSWILLSLGSFVLYFLFRKLLVASPQDLLIFCPYLPHSISSLFIDSCSTHSRYISSSSASSSSSSSSSSLLPLYQDTILMLFSLFITPLRTVISMASSNSSNTTSSAAAAVTASFSSFYLDQSELIRRAENPFAFLDNATERFYSFSYLHFRYIYLLLYPRELCAEYSFNCIPKVSTWEDNGQYRVVYALLMYLSLFLVGLYGLYALLRTIRLSFKTVPSTQPSHHNHSHNFLDTIHPLGILIALQFLVIPFIPASGIFLRLGTLLAERLLYVPSIGYCYLLSILLHAISFHLLSLLSSPFPSLSSRQALLLPILSLLLCSPTLLFFTTRTIQRNLDWKDDRTLFFSSYEICPQSAKLNLQIAKIYLNEHNYSLAEFHIQQAVAIDPTFCDISHQQALLAIVYYQDVEQATHHLLQSLKCVYTLSGSWKILSQIWEDRMRKSPKDFNLVSEIGDQCYEAGLSMMALRQYQQATSLAIDQNKYQTALKFSIKAEKALKKLFKELLNQPSEKKMTGPPPLLPQQRLVTHPPLGLPDITLLERRPSNHFSSSKSSSDQSISWEVYRELECNVYSLGGLLRHQMSQEDSQKKSSKSSTSSGYSKSILEEISRSEVLLMMALRPVCVYDVSDPSDERVLVPHKVSFPLYPPIILQSLTQHYTAKFQQARKDITLNNNHNHSDVLYSLAVFTDRASSVYGQYYQLKIRELTNPEETFSLEVKSEDPITGELFQFYKQMKDSLQSSLQFYKDAGEAYFHTNQFQQARRCYERILEITSGNLEKIWGEDMKTLQVPCSVTYWYAHVIATNEEFLDHVNEIERVIKLLNETITCLSTSHAVERDLNGAVIASSELKKHAKEQIKELNSYLQEVRSEAKREDVLV